MAVYREDWSQLVRVRVGYVFGNARQAGSNTSIYGGQSDRSFGSAHPYSSLSLTCITLATKYKASYDAAMSIVRPFLSRRLLARLMSTFLCATLVLVRPFSRFGGDSAFLALTIQTLAFFAQDTLAAQIEITVLNLAFGALLGIGWAVLAKTLSSFCQADSAAARVVTALALITIIFFAGWVKSRLPRLTLAARMCAFISIWLLTKTTRNVCKHVRGHPSFHHILTHKFTKASSGCSRIPLG